MQERADAGRFGEAVKGRVGVLIEQHFDPTGFKCFNQYFPAAGYEVVYMSHLWGQPSLTFDANAEHGTIDARVIVTTEVAQVDLRAYAGIILIGAYAMDRLRYQSEVRKGEPNRAPAVEFLRRVVSTQGLKIGTICHSLWLFCADRALLSGKRVTCAHNIICDVENAGAEVIYDGDQTAEIVVDGDLITGKHSGMIDAFMDRFLYEMASQKARSSR